MTSAPANQAVSVVNVAASAGGFVPLRALLGALPSSLEAAVVVTQHLAPMRESRLDQMLKLACRLPVRTIEDGDLPIGGAIHVTPAGADLVIKEGRLRLVAAPARISPQPSIDRFLHSLAADRTVGAKVAVILSGLGADGADGVRVLRRAGGLCLAQLPSEAHAASMPESALETGCVHYAAPAAELGQRLPGLLRWLAGQHDQWEESGLAALDAACRGWEQIGTGRFLPGFVARDASLRRQLLGLDSPASYLAHVQTEPVESAALLRQLIEPLGRFTVRGAAKELLFAELVGAYREWSGPRPFRAWSLGCAQGEEAYLMAMTLEDTRHRYGLRADYLVYGTDLLADAVSAGRFGAYELEELTELDADFRQRHFVSHLRHWQVKPEIRRRMLFSVHDAVRDVPLPGMHFISCLGVLDRLRPEVSEGLRRRLSDSLPPQGRLVAV